MTGLLMMAMIFLTMMGMVLRVVGMVMALVLSLTMMGMVLTITMVLTTIAMVLTIAMVHLIVTKAIVQSEVMSHDLLMVDSAPKCVTCMPGQTVSVWVIMTRCSPGMGGGTVM